MTITELEDKYKLKGKNIGGMLLLESDSAINFLDEGINSGFLLAGVEGFKLYGEKIQPFQEYSNDIADTSEDQSNFIDNTKAMILAGKENNIWFEVLFS